ncbi:MAG: hypothetical protein E7576_15265 [Ruminococcaceae bacterium]|jgi:hypothetical protein|nr:hypothetical protein [Oscillospiraceae bacterium]
MNRKLYLAALGLIFIVLLFGAPFMKAGADAGLFEVRDLGNMGEEAQFYENAPEDGVLNTLVGFKKTLTDLYTDFMPGYYETVFAYGKARDTLNAPTASLYADMRSNAGKTQTETPTEPTTSLDTLSNQPIGEEAVDADLPEPEPEEPVDPRDQVVSVSSTLLKSTGTHRYYRIDATFGDGFETSFLDTAVDLTDKAKEARVTLQAKKLNKIAEAVPDVNFYFMLLTRMQDTDYYEDVIVGEESTGKYADLFLSLLDERITAQKWDIGTLRDRVEKVYLTDHHWSTYGSYCGFCQLCEMICPDHEPVALGEPIDFPETRFYGSAARTCQTLDLWDPFRVYDCDLGTYKCSPIWKFERQVKFLAKQKYVTPDVNVYAVFFPEVYTVEYPDNHTGRNLLVIGDSYTQGFVELLGSAFDKTVAYYYTHYSGMDYRAVIEENGITDVLFEQFSDRILFDIYGDDRLSAIVLD